MTIENKTKTVRELERSGGQQSDSLRRLQSGRTGDDLDKFAGDHRLTSSVEGQREFADHLAGVLTGVLHGGHSSRLFRARVLFHCVEQQTGQRVLLVGLQRARV